MGSYRTSAARAGSILWRAVRSCKDFSRSRNSPDPVDLLGNHHISRHIHQQLRWVVGPGSVALSGEQLSSVCSSLREDLAKRVKDSSYPGIKNLMSGRQFFAREISSQVSKSIGHDEDAEAKDGDGEVYGDLKEDDDDVRLNVDDGDSASVALSEKIRARKSEMELLAGRILNFKRKGETAAEIQRHISSGLEFTKDDSLFLISRLRRYSRYLQAAETADLIAETKMFPWTTSDQVTRIMLKGKLGLTAEIENIFNSSPPELQTEIAYNAVIKHLCERGMVRKGNEWLDRLMKSGQLTHAFAFNRLLVLYKDRRRGDKVDSVLEAMSSVGIARDIYTYNILMSIKGRENDVAGIEAVFGELMADPNVEVDPPTYATLAGTYIALGLTEKATAALEEGERIGFDKTGNVDEVIATLWAKLGNKEKVLSLWEIMKQREFVPARTYIVMIESFGKLGMVEQAEALFHEMQQTKGRVRPRQFTALLTTYASNGLFDKAEALVEGISSLELKRSAVTNHHIVGAYLKMGKLDKALAVLSEAKWKGGFPLWFTTTTVLLNAVAEKGDVITAEKVFSTLKSTYNQKNLTAYNILLKAYANAGLPAEGVLLRMATERIPPNKETRDLLQLCSARASNSGQRREPIPTTATVES